MNARLSLGLVVVLGLSTLYGAAALWAAQSRRYGRYRIRTPNPDPLPARRKLLHVSVNGALSLACYLGALHFASGYLVGDASPGPLGFAVEVLAALLLYDLLYYAAHRCCHRPRLMRAVHGVHHRVRYPTAFDGLYVHPAELVGGLGLLLASIAAVGPVSVASFLTVAFLHALANIAVHTNLVLPHPVFALTNYWAVRHDHHHHGHLDANYGSIFPFWDRALGTYR